MPTLVPRWKSVPLSEPATPLETELFEPLVVELRGALIVGGAKALSIFQVGTKPRLFYVVKAREWITGFCESGGELYVQDGVVLSAWHLSEHRCRGAVNLITRERWSPDEDDAQLEPPEDLYKLPASLAPAQSALLNARNRHMTAIAAGVRDEIAAAEKALQGALPGAENLIFSAPVVRDRQFEGGSGRIFSLCLNGPVYSVTEELEVATVLTHDNPPLRAELAMAELPQPGGKVLCYLYFVGKDGSIVVLDASDDLKKHSTRWASVGVPVADKVLPLRCVDGLLFGGGILNANFFVLELDSARPPRVTVTAPDGGWKHYEISVADQMVLLSNGTVSRLIAYGEGAKLRDRWGQRNSAEQVHSIFWKGTGNEGPRPSPKLVIEVAKQAAGSNKDVRFNVVLANTIDAVDVQLSSTYPPAASQLSDGTLTGLEGDIPSVGRLRCRPMVMQQTLYCVVRPTNSATDASRDVLVAYSIAQIRNDVAAAAELILERNRVAVTPLRVQIRATEYYAVAMEKYEWGPEYVFANRDVLVIVGPPDVERTVRTDGNGEALFDTALLGAQVRVSKNMRSGPNWGYTSETTSARLEVGTTGIARVTFYVYR